MFPESFLVWLFCSRRTFFFNVKSDVVRDTLLCSLDVSFHRSRLTPPRPGIRRPFWYTFYVFQTVLFITGAYPMLLQKMDGLLGGFEQVTLNGIWILLVGIEVLMVVGVAFTTVIRTLRTAPKQKAQ